MSSGITLLGIRDLLQPAISVNHASPQQLPETAFADHSNGERVQTQTLSLKLTT